MSRKARHCEICGLALAWSGVGRAPKRCLEHRRNRARDLARASAREGPGRPTVVMVAERDTTSDVSRAAWRSRRMAIGLGLDADPARAASLVGLVPESPEELASLVLAARRDHQELSERRTSASASLLQTVINLCAVRLAERVDEVGPGVLAAQIKALTVTLQALQGHTGTAYSRLTLVVEGPQGELWDPVTGETRPAPAKA